MSIHESNVGPESSGRKRAALYLRISVKSTEGSRANDDGEMSYSVDDQRIRCEALCEAAGYEVVKPYFYDDGVSAYRSRKDRRDYSDMKAALAAGAFDVLVFDRQDRLARDQIETMRLAIDCAEKGISWHSAQEGEINLHDNMALTFAMFRGGEAQAYSDKISKNQKASNVRKRELGLPGAGPRPFGYEKWDPTSPYVQDIREEEADLIRRGTAMILAGVPRYQVMKMFRDSGTRTTNDRPWHTAKVTKVLTRWRNAGVTEWDDKPHGPAIWPAIVSVEDVEEVRRRVARGPAQGQWKTPTWLCSGIAKCRCGWQMVATGSKAGPSYRCGEILATGSYSPGQHVSITARIMDAKVREGLLDAYMDRPVSSDAGKAEAATLTRLYKRRDELDADLERVKRGFLAGILDEPDAARERVAIDAKLAEINAEIDSAAAESAHATMLAKVHAQLWLGAEPGGIKDSYLRAIERDYGVTREEAINRAIWSQWVELNADGTGLDPNPSPEYTRIRGALAETFDGMDLDSKRNLVRSTLSIKVLPVEKGRTGADRVVVNPL